MIYYTIDNVLFFFKFLVNLCNKQHIITNAKRRMINVNNCFMLHVFSDSLLGDNNYATEERKW